MSLEELYAASDRKPEFIPSPFEDMSREDLEKDMVRRPTWRYHHNIPVLEHPVNERTLHSAYARRVSTMFAMLDDAIERTGIDISKASICDLACAEGFVAGRLVDQGAKSVDCFELNREQIERLHLVNAWKSRTGIAVHNLDFEAPFWSRNLNKYDLVMCLGIVYHMENPLLFLRNVFEITGEYCIVESDTPGGPDVSALYPVDQQATKKLGDVRYMLEMRPSIKALTDMLLCVGFSSVEHIRAPADAVCPYLASGKKSILLARR